MAEEAISMAQWTTGMKMTELVRAAEDRVAFRQISASYAPDTVR